MPEWLIRDRRSPEMVLHPSTEGAMMAVRSLAPRLDAPRILDIGCGSGLLSLIAAETWPDARILATDISEGAVADATLNIRQYGLEQRIKICHAEGYDHLDIAAGAPYDVIIANLVAPLLVSYAGEMRKYLAPDGYAIISGILAWRWPLVEEAHQSLGFEVAEEISRKEWRTAILRLA